MDFRSWLFALPVALALAASAPAQMGDEPPRLPAPTPAPAPAAREQSAPAVSTQAAPAHVAPPGWGCRWFVDAGLYVLQPTWDNNPAAVILQSNSVAVHKLDFATDVAPWVRVGCVAGQGLEFGLRYWGLDRSSARFLVENPGPPVRIETQFLRNLPGAAPQLNVVSTTAGDRLAVSGRLDLDVWDLEVSQQACVGQWSFLLGGGLRFADLRQGAQAERTNPAFASAGAVVSVATSVTAQSEFRGAGPTVALEAHRSLGCGLSLYGSARGTLLYGDNEQRASLRDVQRNLTTSQVTTTNTSSRFSSKDTLPVTELEVGAAWEVAMAYKLLTVQVGLIHQVWHNAGSPTVPPGESDLGLFGVRVTAGLTF
jgi:hypothetical protein